MDAVWILRSPSMATAETATGFLRIAHRDLRTALAMADALLFEEATWGFHLQLQMLRDQSAAVEPFVGLSRFTLYAVVWRYDEEPDVENLDRTVWNQRCSELLDAVHRAALRPAARIRAG